MSKSTRNEVVSNPQATSDSTHDRFRARYQCYSNNPDVLRALIAYELPEELDMAVRVHVWNCQRCRNEYSKLKAESVPEAKASSALSLSAKDPVVQLPESDVGMKPQTASVEYADFRKLLEQLLSGQQTKEALLLDPVFQQRLPIICKRFASNAADADDLTNHVRLVVCQRLDQFKPNYQLPYGNFFNWVSRIARNKAIDDFRRTVVRQSDSPIEEAYAVLDDRVDVEAETERHEAVERFWAFTAKLDPVTQKIMHYHVEDNSLREIEAKLAAEGIKLSHVAIGKLIRNGIADFIASENARFARTISRKGRYLSRGRDRKSSDPSARKTGS